MADFTNADKANLLELLVNDERCLMTIYEVLFANRNLPHNPPKQEMSIEVGSERTASDFGGSLTQGRRRRQTSVNVQTNIDFETFSSQQESKAQTKDGLSRKIPLSTISVKSSSISRPRVKPVNSTKNSRFVETHSTLNIVPSNEISNLPLI